MKSAIASHSERERERGASLHKNNNLKNLKFNSYAWKFQMINGWRTRYTVCFRAKNMKWNLAFTWKIRFVRFYLAFFLRKLRHGVPHTLLSNCCCCVFSAETTADIYLAMKCILWVKEKTIEHFFSSLLRAASWDQRQKFVVVVIWRIFAFVGFIARTRKKERESKRPSCQSNALRRLQRKCQKYSRLIFSNLSVTTKKHNLTVLNVIILRFVFCYPAADVKRKRRNLFRFEVFYLNALMTMTMINYSKIDGILFDATECIECKAPTPQKHPTNNGKETKWGNSLTDKWIGLNENYMFDQMNSMFISSKLKNI